MACENGIQVPFLFFVFAWHWKTDLNFAFCFSFSPTLWKTDLNFVSRFRITLKNGFEFRFSFLYGLLLKNRSEFRLSFLHDLKNGSLHQSSHLRSPDMHTLGVDRGIHFLCKWKQVNFTLPGAKVRSELPPPPPHEMSYKHGTPFFNKGWLVIRWQPRKKPVSVKRRLRTRGKMQRECKMLTADWE